MSAPHVKGNVAVLNQNWSAFFYFVAFVMLVAFILLNLYIGEGGGTAAVHRRGWWNVGCCWEELAWCDAGGCLLSAHHRCMICVL